MVFKHACVVFTAVEPASSFLVANLCVHIFRFPCTFFAVKFCFDVSVLQPRKELRWSAKSLAERTHGLGEYTFVSRNHMKKGKKKEEGIEAVGRWRKVCVRCFYWSMTSTQAKLQQVILAKFKSFQYHILNKHTNQVRLSGCRVHLL